MQLLNLSSLNSRRKVTVRVARFACWSASAKLFGGNFNRQLAQWQPHIMTFLWHATNLIPRESSPCPPFAYEKFTTATTTTTTPLLLSSLCLQHRELTCGKRRNIQRLSRGCLSPTGVYFLPPRHCWEIKTLWTSHGPIEVRCMLPSSPSSRRWQASLELSVRPRRWGSATGHPQGPISAGVPRKGPSNDPRRRCCNRTS